MSILSPKTSVKHGVYQIIKNSRSDTHLQIIHYNLSPIAVKALEVRPHSVVIQPDLPDNTLLYIFSSLFLAPGSIQPREIVYVNNNNNGIFKT